LGETPPLLTAEFLAGRVKDMPPATFFLVVGVNMTTGGTMSAKLIHKEGEPPDPLTQAIVLNQLLTKQLQDSHALLAQMGQQKHLN